MGITPDRIQETSPRGNCDIHVFHVHTHMYLYLYIYIHVMYMYLYMYIHIYIPTHICMHALLVNIHTHASMSNCTLQLNSNL